MNYTKSDIYVYILQNVFGVNHSNLETLLLCVTIAPSMHRATVRHGWIYHRGVQGNLPGARKQKDVLSDGIFFARLCRSKTQSSTNVINNYSHNRNLVCPKLDMESQALFSW